MKSQGNVFLYVLIAVLLLGGLSFAISKNGDSNPQGELSDASAKATVTSILTYQAAAKTVILQMTQSGIGIDQIDYMLPSDANFNTAPTFKKLFHPDGGGLQYKPLPAAAIGRATTTPVNGYYIGRFNNVEWTPTTARDIVFAAYGLNKPVCEALNKKLTGSSTMPLVSTVFTQRIIDTAVTGAGNTNFMASYCPACENKVSLCVEINTSPNFAYAYYSILFSN